MSVRLPNPSEEALDGIRSLLKDIGEDVERDGLIDTPKRVTKAFRELTEGAFMSPWEILNKQFDCPEYDQVVSVRNIDFVSLCEHHLLPFTGQAFVAYLPNEKVVGLSKIPRLVECFSKRLQLQERMTMQIASSLVEILKVRGACVVVEAHHSCMGCRGVKKPNATMVTSAMLGEFRTNESLRQEVLSFR